MALFRLAWRPLTLLLSWFVVMAGGWPLIRIGELDGAALANLLSVQELPLVESARWQLTVLLPASIGMVVLLVRAEVMGSALGWMLPGVRRGWLAGELLVAVPLAAGAAVMAGFTRGAILPLAAAGVALLAWNLPGVILHERTPGVWRSTAIAALVFGAAFPAQMARLAAATPATLAGTAMMAGGVLLVVRHSAMTARESWLWGKPAAWESGLGAWLGGRRAWAYSLATDRAGPWLRAIFYESGLGSLRRTVWMRLIRAGILAVLTYVLMHRTMLILWIGMLAGDMTLGPLRTGLLYPLSREQRARLLFRASLMDGLTTCVLLVGGTLLLEFIALPFEPRALGDQGPPSLALITLVALALLPLAIYGTVRSTLETWRSDAWNLGRMSATWAPLFAYVVVATTLIQYLQAMWASGSEALVLGGLGLAGVVMYFGFWYATLRHYRRCDLVSSP